MLVEVCSKDRNSGHLSLKHQTRAESLILILFCVALKLKSNGVTCRVTRHPALPRTVPGSSLMSWWTSAATLFCPTFSKFHPRDPDFFSLSLLYRQHATQNLLYLTTCLYYRQHAFDGCIWLADKPFMIKKCLVRLPCACANRRCQLTNF